MAADRSSSSPGGRGESRLRAVFEAQAGSSWKPLSRVDLDRGFGPSRFAETGKSSASRAPRARGQAASTCPSRGRPDCQIGRSCEVRDLLTIISSIARRTASMREGAGRSSAAGSCPAANSPRDEAPARSTRAGRGSLSSMSGLSPRPSRPLSRRQREERAYRLVMVGGAAAIAVVGVVLVALGVVSGGVPLLAIAVAAICGLLFRRTVSGR